MSNRRPSTLAETLFVVVAALAVVVPLALLLGLVGNAVVAGASRLGWDFITSYPSRHAEQAGVLPALVGSLYLVSLTALMALPVGVGAAIYLEEYGQRGRFARLVEINIANLAGVPSIIYGLLGLGVFVRFFGMGRSLIAGACTMALLVLPVIITASREALRTVPHGLREAALALGATRFQMVRQVVLPLAVPGILTGAILSIARAIGETAPLVVVGALTYVTFLPDGLDAPFTALPIMIFNWVSRPQAAFVATAAAGIVVLLVVMLLLNAVAVLLRNHFERKVRS